MPSHPYPNAPLALVTDVSDVAIGASLEGKRDVYWKAIGFSQKLTSAETRYCTYDRELLVILAAIQFFQHTLESRAFATKTYHKPLVCAFTKKLDKANSRRLRQLDFMSPFSTQITS